MKVVIYAFYRPKHCVLGVYSILTNHYLTTIIDTDTSQVFSTRETFLDIASIMAWVLSRCS